MRIVGPLSVLIVGITIAIAPGEAQVKLPNRPKPNTNVQRKDAPTPEVKGIEPNRVRAGSKPDLKIGVANFVPVKVTGHGICAKLTNQKITAEQVTFSLDLTGVQAGSCDIEMVDANGQQMSARLQVDPPPNQYEIAEQQREAAQVSGGKKMLGSQWSIHLPDGKVETWKVGEFDPKLPYVNVQDAKGSTFKTVYQSYNGNGSVMVQLSGQCMLQGSVRGGKIQGMAVGAGGCPYPQMSQWWAEIK